ncbi:MAG TPA: IclR family transcriptional regulator C-terminal domain-containing protein [Acidimicrobiales bacterium]|nr:IclR family transcriptional regulator C-terminal domain-containing protein [Acidimicrobiales bacterium]
MAHSSSVGTGGELEHWTDATKIGVANLCAELTLIRQCGHGTGEAENELGIGCFGLPVFFASSVVPGGAISISALIDRTALARLVDELPAIGATVIRDIQEAAG